MFNACRSPLTAEKAARERALAAAGDVFSNVAFVENNAEAPLLWYEVCGFRQALMRRLPGARHQYAAVGDGGHLLGFGAVAKRRRVNDDQIKAGCQPGQQLLEP